MGNALFPHFYTGFFQFGYVTNNIEQAIDNLKKHYGIKNFLDAGMIPSNIKLADGSIANNELHLAFAYVGDQQVELIQPLKDESGFYSNALKNSDANGDFEILLHHLGCRFHEIEQWHAFKQQLNPIEHSVAFENEGGNMHYLYTDERKMLGHFLEYMWLDDEGSALFDAIPQNP